MVYLRNALLIWIWGALAGLPLSAAGQTTALALAEKIAQASGVHFFPQVEVLEFTFHVQRGDRSVARKWRWLPARDEVHYQGPGPEGREILFRYRRQELKADTSRLIRFVDQRFINDQYWLLFPFHLVWDTDRELSYRGKAPFPIPPGQGYHLVVQYHQVGYTPGDIYELFVGEDFFIRQWIYRRAGQEAPSLIATWEGYVKLGPFWLSTEHRDAENNFHLWFTGVRIKMKGSNLWLEPEGMPR